MFGYGMAVIPLVTIVVPVEEGFNELVKMGFCGYSTFEIAGEDAVKKSLEFLKELAGK